VLWVREIIQTTQIIHIKYLLPSSTKLIKTYLFYHQQCMLCLKPVVLAMT